MKILFAIQGTGNGHLSRARDVYPELAKYGTVDVLVSGIQVDVAVPFPIKYQCYGLSFIFGKRGGVDIIDTARKLQLGQLLRNIKQLPVTEYDLVVNDFEPISAWACKRHKKACISLSHQYAVMHELAPKPGYRDLIGETVLQRYAPVTAGYGFHFEAFAPNIFTPVIRQDIRALHPVDKGHYTVYLPAYSDETIVQHLSQFPNVKWQVFSKHCKLPFVSGNISVRKIDNKQFVESMEGCTGILCGAGFEGPAEAMYLGKKVMVVPMAVQYEQHCNAAGAVAMGASMIGALDAKAYPALRRWINEGQAVKVDYPDSTAEIIAKLMHEHAPAHLYKPVATELVAE